MSTGHTSAKWRRWWFPAICLLGLLVCTAVILRPILRKARAHEYARNSDGRFEVVIYQYPTPANASRETKGFMRAQKVSTSERWPDMEVEDVTFYSTQPGFVLSSLVRKP